MILVLQCVEDVTLVESELEEYLLQKEDTVGVLELGGLIGDHTKRIL